MPCRWEMGASWMCSLQLPLHSAMRSCPTGSFRYIPADLGHAHYTSQMAPGCTICVVTLKHDHTWATA